MKRFIVAAMFFMVLGISPVSGILAQGTKIQCGDIIEGEFTSQEQTIEYQIDLAPRDILKVSGTVVGDFLKFDIGVYAPSESLVGYFKSEYFRSDDGSATPSVETGILGERGTYKVYIKNGRAFGIYTLFVGCTLADGRVIEPGDALQDSGVVGQSGTSVTIIDTPPFEGFGFPGLPPVDFTNAIAIPFQMGDVPNVGSIAPGFESVFGFTFEGNAGDTFALNFVRLSGNLSLNLTVLSANNEVAYQATLVTSSAMSSTFTLPSSGTYTVGVSKSTVGAPATPENTTFQLTGALNP